MSEKIKKIKHSLERNERVRKAHIGRKRSDSWKNAIRHGLLNYYKRNPEAGEIKNKNMFLGLHTISKKKIKNRPETILFNNVKEISCLLPIYNYKVGIYYIDVALPDLKIGFECDGERWHLDKDKDTIRDITLFNSGWIIYRFPSQKLFKELSLVKEIVQRVISGSHEN